jgi:UDP-3-O-[3-hydroxymyristoyl] N-acetylglucosamine deacetylase
MIPFSEQSSIARSVKCTGVGLHSGKTVVLTIHPAPINHGIKFFRTDLPNSPGISAHFNMVVDTSQATVIGNNGFIVSTIEHLMAAFAGLSIDNARVELTDYEVPMMDGSAGPFARLLRSAGIVSQPGPRCYFVVNAPIELKENGKSVAVYPADTSTITCTIDYDHPVIGHQSRSVVLCDRAFEEEIAPARTFGLLQDLEYMKNYGLAKGGSLDNAVVVAGDGIVNPEGLRFADEFVRHKILDCIGDFSLLGMPILGHIVAERSGHAFNYLFLKKFFSSKDSWETRTIHPSRTVRTPLRTASAPWPRSDAPQAPPPRP